MKKNSLSPVLAGVVGGLIFVLFFIILKLTIVVSILLAAAAFILTAIVTKPKRVDPGMDLFLKGVESAEHREVLRRGFEKQQRLKQLKNKISKREIKERVARIIDVVDRIFEDFKVDPKDIRTGRQFLNNYLDSTIKIIEKYVDLSAHNVRSGDLEKTLIKTEELLDKLYHAFEMQLAKLLEDDALDLTTEVEVLEKTLKMEGLDTSNG